MRVTFDSNVWNRMVFPERHVNSPNYLSLVEIKNAIRSGPVHRLVSMCPSPPEAHSPDQLS